MQPPSTSKRAGTSFALCVLASLSLVLSANAASPAGRSANALPKLLTGIRANSFAVRPREILYTGDGSGVLGGFDGSGVYPHDGHLSWRSWTTSEATAKGAVWLDDCMPDCAQGKFHAYAVGVRAFEPGGGHFMRLTLRYRYRGKQVIDRRVVEKIGSTYQYALASG